MSKSFPKSPEVRPPQGFTLVELLVAMALTLILLGIAFNIFDKLNNAADLAGTMADVNENLRAGTNMIARDLSTAGAEIPLGGFPLPSGGTPCQAIKIPLPAWLPAQVFNPACSGNMNVITPGSGFGPPSGSGGTEIPTDAITLITVNPTSQLNEFQLFSISPVTTSGAYCCFPAGTISVTITVNPATNGGDLTAAGASQVLPGQLIMLTNANSAVLLAVSSVTASTITFTSGDAANDVLGLNQFPTAAGSPTSGNIGQLQTLGAAPAANFYPATYAYQVTMTTYYLDNVSRAPTWMLMKQVGTGAPLTGTPPTVPSQPPQPVAMGINVLQFAYSLYPAAEPTDPTRTFVGSYTPKTIRKVNLWLIAKADHPNRKSGLYYTNSAATSVTAQNLAYYNQY
jgi:prepilin-type N-terminal cleavage/methylation domain-containing protein